MSFAHRVKMLFSRADVASVDAVEKISFRDACAWGNLSHVSVLLADVSTTELDQKDDHGCTPLLLSLEHGHEEIATMLLHKGACATAVDKELNSGLHFAAFGGCQRSIVLLLETYGMDVNCQNVYGSTPLHWAVHWSRPDVVSILLQHGARADITDRAGKVAAAYTTDLVLLALLAKAGTVEAKTVRSLTPTNSPTIRLPPRSPPRTPPSAEVTTQHQPDMPGQAHVDPESPVSTRFVQLGLRASSIVTIPPATLPRPFTSSIVTGLAHGSSSAVTARSVSPAAPHIVDVDGTLTVEEY